MSVADPDLEKLFDLWRPTAILHRAIRPFILRGYAGLDLVQGKQTATTSIAESLRSIIFVDRYELRLFRVSTSKASKSCTFGKAELLQRPSLEVCLCNGGRYRLHFHVLRQRNGISQRVIAPGH